MELVIPKLRVKIKDFALQEGDKVKFIKASAISNNLIQCGYKKDAFGNETSEPRLGLNINGTIWKSGIVQLVDNDGNVSNYFGSVYNTDFSNGIRLDPMPEIPDGEIETF